MKSFGDFLVEYDGAGAQARRRRQMRKGMLPTPTGERQRADAAGKAVAAKAVASTVSTIAQSGTTGRARLAQRVPASTTLP